MVPRQEIGWIFSVELSERMDECPRKSFAVVFAVHADLVVLVYSYNTINQRSEAHL